MASRIIYAVRVKYDYPPIHPVIGIYWVVGAISLDNFPLSSEFSRDLPNHTLLEHYWIITFFYN